MTISKERKDDMLQMSIPEVVKEIRCLETELLERSEEIEQYEKYQDEDREVLEFLQKRLRLLNELKDLTLDTAVSSSWNKQLNEMYTLLDNLDYLKQRFNALYISMRGKLESWDNEDI